MLTVHWEEIGQLFRNDELSNQRHFADIIVLQGLFALPRLIALRTLYSLRPSLTNVPAPSSKHFDDLWRHRDCKWHP